MTGSSAHCINVTCALDQDRCIARTMMKKNAFGNVEYMWQKGCAKQEDCGRMSAICRDEGGSDCQGHCSEFNNATLPGKWTIYQS